MFTYGKLNLLYIDSIYLVLFALKEVDSNRPNYTTSFFSMPEKKSLTKLQK